MIERQWRTLAKGLVGIVCAGLVGPVAAQQTLPEQGIEVVEVRVHGNHSLDDATVIELAGVTLGVRMDPAELDGIEARLRASGRFERARVERRYRSLSRRDRVTLLITVQERVSAASKFLVWPEFHYREGDGFSLGARVSAKDLLGGGELISVPATFGGIDRVALEVSRYWPRGYGAGAALELRGRENPHFKVRDRRTRGELWASRRVGGAVKVRVHAAQHDVEFDGVDDRLRRYGAEAALDTRRSRAFPYDSVLASGAWERVDPERGSAVNRYRTEIAVYRTLFGQLVFAGRGLLHTADGPLPAYERPYVGGMDSLRGYRAGTFSGDSAALGTVELRLPVTDVLTGSIARVGVAAFFDVGAAWDHGASIHDQRFRQGVGAGAFLIAPFVRLNLDVANDLHGNTRVHFGTGFRF